MANTRIHNDAAIAACNAVVDLVDTNGPGTIEIRTGTPPTNCGDADSGTLLGTLTLSATAFGNAADGTDKATAAAATITGDTSADTDGTAGHFRAKDGNGKCIIQGDITATSGGGDMELDDIVISTGDSIDVTSWTFNIPET